MNAEFCRSEEQFNVAEEKREGQPSASNIITNETGQLDARFVLWRVFCDEHGVPVDTLPSELTGKAKESWEKLKESGLKNLKEGK